MNVLVTGGAGYVGSVLVPMLLDRGYKVRVLDSLLFHQASLLPCFFNDNFEFMKGDVRKESDVKKSLEGIDFIVHLAAFVGAPICENDPRLAQEVNFGGTENIVRLRNNKQKIIFPSTTSGYGTKTKVKDYCTEDTPLEPISTYGKTKVMSENLLLEAGNSIVFRFATAFGLSPRLRLDLLANFFTYQAFTHRYLVVFEKDFRRTFIHIRDMARAFIFAIENFDKVANGIYNVGSNDLNFSKEELALKVKEQIDYYIHFSDIGSDPDRRDYRCSYDKINSKGYNTTISIEQGIKELLKGFQMVTINNPFSNTNSL